MSFFCCRDRRWLKGNPQDISRVTQRRSQKPRRSTDSLKLLTNGQMPLGKQEVIEKRESRHHLPIISVKIPQVNLPWPDLNTMCSPQAVVLYHLAVHQ